VADKVVLDLKYEARDVPQRLTVPERPSTPGSSRRPRDLNGFQKVGAAQALGDDGRADERGRAQAAHHSPTSSKTSACKPRLNDDRGTAILVAASIYDACHYFRLFQNTSLRPVLRNRHVATSPITDAISREPANSDERYKFDTYTQHVLSERIRPPRQYEDETKQRFIKEPANMKLLIVVSKLLTGFDAPSCTYIYLDNELRDHNLVPGDLPDQPSGRRRQGLRPHRRLQGAVRRRAGSHRRVQLGRAGHRRG
jgi:type I restriction enzyme R subunit